MKLSRHLNPGLATIARPDARPGPPVDIAERGRWIREIIDQVAAKHGFTYLEMVGRRRTADVVRARQEAYWRCMRETVFSVPTIGRHFGGRDHTTVLHGVRVHAERMKAAEGRSVEERNVGQGTDQRLETDQPPSRPDGGADGAPRLLVPLL